MAEPATLLVADDDPGLRESLERTLTREGYRVVLASDGRAALERVQAGGVDLIVTDLRMPGLTGLELLRAAKAIMPDVDVILLTAFGTVEEAVKAMKDGAYDFLTKPFRREQLIKLVDKALERRDLIEQNKALKKQLEDIRAKGQMIGSSPAFRRMLTLVEQIADSSATILIQGESGAGKELVARTVHERSGRRNGPFVAVNCAALPETLLESELFGYEKGAFTGAAGRKEGRFELANGGTLFLDEVADLSLVTQPKILRVLQEGEFERLGGTRSLQVDVRIVAATNQDLPEMVKEKRFREDLYYRLNVITVRVPPLRERHEDIRVLAQHYLRVYAAKNGRKLEGFSNEALERLESYAWPGNVRELENLIERTVLLARKDRLDAEDLPEEGGGGDLGARLHALGSDRRQGRAPLRARTGDAVDRPRDGARSRRCHRRARAHLVRRRGGPLDPHAPPDPAVRDPPQHRATAAVEGRPARQRLPAVELDREDGRGGRRSSHRGLLPDARGHPGSLPRRSRARGRHSQRHRSRPVPPDREPRRPGALRHPRAVRALRRAHHRSEGDLPPARGGAPVAVGRAGRALRLCARHSRDRGAPPQGGAGAPERRVDRRHAAGARRRPALQSCRGLRLPVGVRALRPDQPRGDGVRDAGGRLGSRRHPRGRGRR